MAIDPLQLLRGEIDENDTNAATPEAPADILLERPPIQHTRIDPVVIRHALEAVLASDQTPPPSMRLVVDRLGQTPATLHHYFPVLCRAIASRHRSDEEARDAHTRTRVREIVRDATIALTHRSFSRASHIADVLGDRNVMRSHTAQAAWREVTWAGTVPTWNYGRQWRRPYGPNGLNILRLPHSTRGSAHFNCKHLIGSRAGSIVLPKRQNYELISI